ncbi:MAG: N-acetylglucosaminyl-phosphatidylinositol biosynthetic protein [uncultured bacterium]|nr:MAG: N-acetylglucosaminyl-phosphatidylinositol biosynthetic protein [uncultured bacterium]
MYLLRKKIILSNFDFLIFSGSWVFFLAGYLSGTPLYRIYYGSQFNAVLEKYLPNQQIKLIDQILNIVGNLYIYLINLFYASFSKKNIAISNFAANEFRKLYKFHFSEPIYLGSTRFVHQRRNRTSRNSVNLLSVSRLTPYKGFHFLINCLKKIKSNKQIKITIVGSQPKLKYVNYLNEIGGNIVKIIINPSDNQLAAVYQNTDIYLTADRYLYFGMPVLEAAEFAIPTIALNSAAASEIIRYGQTGYVANNESEFIKYLTELIEKNSFRKKMGLSAKKWAQKFTWEICAKKWENILFTSMNSREPKK